MSSEEKPYTTVERSHIPEEWLTSDGQPVNGLTVAQRKRLELITRMTQDRDPVEYMRIFTFLTVWVLCCGLAKAVFSLSIAAIVLIVASIAYFLFVRKRLASDTIRLQQNTSDFDRYLWEGFQLKEMRQSAVKLGLYLFLPISMVFLGDLLFSVSTDAPAWLFYLGAYSINLIVWWFFFQEDAEHLESLSSDLNALQYL